MIPTSRQLKKRTHFGKLKVLVQSRPEFDSIADPSKNLAKN